MGWSAGGSFFFLECPGITGIFLLCPGQARLFTASHSLTASVGPLHCVPSGPTHQSVSYQKSFKPRYRQTQIQANSDSDVSSASNSLCGFGQHACSLGGSLSLSARLAASKLNPWVLGYSPLNSSCLGSELASEAWEGPSFQVEPSGHMSERTRLDTEHLWGFENCLLIHGLMHSEKLERALFPSSGLLWDGILEMTLAWWSLFCLPLYTSKQSPCPMRRVLIFLWLPPSSVAPFTEISSQLFPNFPCI